LINESPVITGFELNNRLIDRDGYVDYHAGFLGACQADALFSCLQQAIEWRHERITVYGRSVCVPRLVAWYGDPGAVYTYSGVRHEPLPWLAPLADLRTRLEDYCAVTFNSVLANLYRDGQDGMGWHSDAEQALGEQPLIASLSLGASRLFKLRHKKKAYKELSLALASGSLLVMGGMLQKKWRHCVVKTRKPVGHRINLTFRLINSTLKPGSDH